MKTKQYYNYLKYILEHKKNIFKTCWKRKLYLHALTHDLSKFSPKEFIPYARYFFISKEEFKQEFDKAWEHHYKNNPHHWNYWLDENGIPQRIDGKYLNQMIADWEAMGLKFGDTAQAYYLNNYRKIKLDRDTRMELEMMLGLNDSLAHNYGHTLEEFANMYDKSDYNMIFNFIKDKYGIDSYELLRKE